VSDRSSSAEVIADRYLTSPSRLRARPFGPVDALDTHAGRASQVRIVFASGEWNEPELAEAVARWCGVGAAGVCGVLDFGRHADRWFLVLPPSLGTPVERWRSMRLPSAADAARLTLSFGRLLESVAAAGFDAGSAVVADFAVGPGPTPFLEQPLLTSPGAAVSITRRAGGQQVLAQLFLAAVADRDLPAGLEEWRTAAAAGAHTSLGGCLDALERAAEAHRAATPDAEPAGLAGIFDGPLTLPPQEPWTAKLRRPGPLVLVGAAVAGLALAVGGGHFRPAATATPGPLPAAPTVAHRAPAIAFRTAPTASKPPAKHPARHHGAGVRRRPVRHSPAARHRDPSSPGTHASPPASPPSAASAPARPGGVPPGGVTLPSPGGTVLPAP
jgi:hypothetical protein